MRLFLLYSFILICNSLSAQQFSLIDGGGVNYSFVSTAAPMPAINTHLGFGLPINSTFGLQT